ncbi:MAG TPA: transposase [Anaerolineales bacterium]|nr:transposase [Anaerolineales bacterium]
MPSKFDLQKHHRRSIRLPNYDYSQAGAYYITIVTHHRALLFGEIVNEEMQLNDYGKVADECWRAISDHFSHVELGAYVIMPNHVHGIIVIHNMQNRMATNSSPSVGARHASPLPLRGVKPGSVGAMVGAFKSAVTKRIRHEFNITGIWQRNYYEHVIRNEQDLQNKTDYIEANPMLWDRDDENPVRFA